MHEVSLCRDLIAMVDEAIQSDGNPTRGVRAINLVLGRFSHVQPSALSFCFEAVAAGTRVEGARLNIECRDAIGTCSRCGSQQSMRERFEACHQCGEFPVTLVEGAELSLKSVEVF